MEIATYFHVFVTGQVEFATFPLGPDASQVFCRYEVVTGPDWELVAGFQAGITQCSTARGHDDRIVFNMPLDFSFKATNPFGWPQILFCVYGKNIWGAETCLGYARVHVPIFGAEKRTTVVPVLIPRSFNLVAELICWITSKGAELRNPKILTDGCKERGLQTDSYGELTVSLCTISRGTKSMGYDGGFKEIC